ncbi:hypothetical protein D9619_002913 [Psilocybe cf. subviscida]|uniref:Uncharacterized protein n=1 Tax=Psilocybe cf. subviscida TaxID=2480587 RepID=A0A8H5EUL1_9AGAR|nr:hypothetical protein D9619_002913 [Psilocybe cf. subviscida]
MPCSSNELVLVDTSITPSNSSQSKLAQSLRGSLRHLAWKTQQATDPSRRVFQRKRAFAWKEPTIKEDWNEEFYVITRDDFDSVTSLNDCAAPASIPSTLPLNTLVRSTEATVTVSSKPPVPPFAALAPLVISDTLNRGSTYTTRSITSTESATPTYTEFAHITSSFPLPPTHIPEGIKSPITLTSYPQSSLAHPVTDFYQEEPSVKSPESYFHTGSTITFQRFKSKARDIFRIPSIRLSWKR